MAAKENFDLIKDDFKDVKPLLIGLSGAYQLDMVNKKVEKFDDVKGLKLRSPSRTGAWYLEELGAEPVGMPLPDVPQSLSKNAIDGAVLPMEVFPAFKFQQLTKYTTEIKGGGGFGGSVLLLLMNKDKFNSLPKDLQAILEESTPKIATVIIIVGIIDTNNLRSNENLIFERFLSWFIWLSPS